MSRRTHEPGLEWENRAKFGRRLSIQKNQWTRWATYIGVQQLLTIQNNPRRTWKATWSPVQDREYLRRVQKRQHQLLKCVQFMSGLLDQVQRIPHLHQSRKCQKHQLENTRTFPAVHGSHQHGVDRPCLRQTRPRTRSRRIQQTTRIVAKLRCNHQCQVRFQHFQRILRQQRQQMFHCGHSRNVPTNPAQPNIDEGRPS